MHKENPPKNYSVKPQYLKYSLIVFYGKVLVYHLHTDVLMTIFEIRAYIEQYFPNGDRDKWRKIIHMQSQIFWKKWEQNKVKRAIQEMIE